MAKVESSWDLCVNGTPRSVAVYINDIPLSTSSSPTNNSNSSNNSNNSKNPFGTSTSTSVSVSGYHKYHRCHSVMVGTERGTLHYRTFANNNTNNNKTSMSRSGGGVGLVQQPLGRENNSHDSNSNNNSNQYFMDIHSLPSKKPIVACVKATPDTNNATPELFLLLQKQESESHSATAGTAKDVALLSSSTISASSNNTSTGTGTGTGTNSKQPYQATILSIRHTTTGTPTASSSTSPSSSSSSNSTNTTYTSSSTAAILNLKYKLPLMSSVAYHPNTGYIYAIENSIQSLPLSAVRKLSSFFNSQTQSSLQTHLQTQLQTQTAPSSSTTSSSSFSKNVQHSTKKQQQQQQQIKTVPNIYYNYNNILPSSAGGVKTCDKNNGTLSIICNGYVTIVAMNNGSFYAVAGHYVPMNFWDSNHHHHHNSHSHSYQQEQQEGQDDILYEYNNGKDGENGMSMGMGRIDENGDDHYNNITSKTATSAATATGNKGKGSNKKEQSTAPTNNTSSSSSSSGSGSGSSKAMSKFHNHEIEKVFTFRQSSFVHPSISVEIHREDSQHQQQQQNHPQYDNMDNDHDDDNNNEDDKNQRNQVHTSLLFLASGRECAIVEIMYNPKLYSNKSNTRQKPLFSNDDYNDDDDNNNDNDTLNMNNMNSSNSNDSDPMMAILPSPSMNYSSIIVSKPKHNVATLASPILAAVGLEPRVHSSSSSTTTTGTTRTGTTRTRMYKKKSKRPSPSSKSTASNTTNTYTTNTNNTNTNNTTSYTTTPLVAILTSDGLIHTRSPSFISIPLSTIEVGNQPNDFFTLTSIQNSYQQQQQQMQMQIIASSYSGESRLIYFAQDTKQDLADRMMKLCIDAFGLKGFPRTELADAIQASFTATTYVGEKANVSSKNLLKQYLETVLGLDMSCDFGGGGAIYKRFLYGDDDNEYDDEDDNEYDDDYNHVEDESSQIMIEDDHEHNHVKDENEHTTTNVSNSSFASSFLSATAILCLVCTQLTSPNATLANRAAKSCANKFGVVGTIQATSINHATVQLCEIIAEQLILQSNTKRQITPPASNSGLATGRDGINMNMVEAATWLLRCCGKHESAIDIILERMNNPSMRNKTFTEESVSSSSGIGFVHTMHNNNMNSTSNSNNTRGTSLGWSQYKYESYISLHLVDLWSYGHHEECRDLVLKSKATRQLLETNPKLGLKIFTSLHPSNEKQWLVVIPRGAEPISDIKSVPTQVVELLKSIRPHIPYNSNSAININKGLDVSSQSVEVRGNDSGSDSNLPLESGRALAVVYLESLVGISTGRPPVSNNVNSNYGDDNFHSVVTDIHNELAFLLLEGVLSERTEDDENVDSDLGKIYREKLRRLLGWHSSKVQPDVLMEALPSTFLREKALLLGQLGRHEDALRIFYFDLKSLELALEYCDARYEKQQVHSVYERKQSFNQLIGGKSKGGEDGCAYLPLVRIALESDQDSERGIAAAIKVLSLRRETINRGAALRLLPKNVPVSALARPFLIPALIDSESQSRRLTVASSLLRAKYVRLKHALTEAQIKSQSYLPNVPALQSLNLGDPVYASKPFKARPSNMSTLHFPDVTITKHFFSRYVVIQATATTTDEMSLNDVQLVVAESSDEALLPSVNVPIKTLPPRITGSSWCVLAASPQRLDGTAILVCEMHYTVPALDSATNVPLNFNTGIGFSSGSSSGRPYVEELQDIEIRRAEFDGF